MISKNSYNRESTVEHPIMIIGAGPAGISTWLHLHKYAPEIAAQTTVIDRAVFPRDKLCAGGIGAWGSDVLEQLEVELDIPSVFISDIEFRFGEERYRVHKSNYFRVIQRIEFDHALVKSAVNRGLKLCEGEALVEVNRDNGSLIVETRRRTYRVKTLIGADGALSKVRQKLIPSQKRRLARAVQVFAPANPEYDTEFDEKKIVFDFTPIKKGLQGYVYHFPCLKDGVPSIAHGTGEVRIHADKPKADIQTIFSRELQLRNIHRVPATWSSHPIRWLSMEDTISQPNVILAGEAAGIEPAFGGGIHIALSFGELVARAVIDAFNRTDFSFHDYKQSLIDHYTGTYIRDHIRAAREIYSGKTNPLTVIRKMFPQSSLPPEMTQQMFAEIAAKLQAS